MRIGNFIELAVSGALINKHFVISVLAIFRQSVINVMIYESLKIDITFSYRIDDSVSSTTDTH